MWPDPLEAPPRPADELLDEVLRRGRELRRVRRQARQLTWIARAAAVVAVTGLAAGLTYGSTDDPGRPRTAEVAAPAVERDDVPGSSSTTAPEVPGVPTTRGPVEELPTDSSTTTAPENDSAGRRVAPLAVVEQRSADGTYRTAVLHPDGALVAVTPATEDRQMPVLSPRGDTIAFQRRAPHPLTGQPRWEIFTVGIDGRGLRQVTGGLVEGGPQLIDTPLGAGSRWPSWSPDGRRLAYSCSGATGKPVICISRADGLLRSAITTEADGFYQPTWSPDGETIAAKRETDDGKVELWLLDAAGAGELALPVPRLDPRGVRLSWTVDGRELVYAQVDTSERGLVIIDVASGQRRLVLTPTPARFPIVCGPGQVLYLQSDIPLEADELRIGPLVLVGSDGSAPTTVLPARPGTEYLPSSCASR